MQGHPTTCSVVVSTLTRKVRDLHLAPSKAQQDACQGGSICARGATLHYYRDTLYLLTTDLQFVINCPQADI